MIKAGTAGIIGYETASGLRKRHAAELEERFSARFMKAFDSLAEKQIHYSFSFEGCLYAAPIKEGGIFGAIWKALDEMEDGCVIKPAGCRIHLDRIPIRQEITEICELYDENPYEIASPGAFIVLWDEDLLKNAKLPDWIRPAGSILRSRDRLIINDDMIRYLTPPDRQKKDIQARRRDITGG